MSNAQYQFQLYVAGNAQNSTVAIANLKAICREYLRDCHEIEIVDVFRQPKRALDEGVFMTPTLIWRVPSPTRRIVGTLSQTLPILHALGLEGPAP